MENLIRYTEIKDLPKDTDLVGFIEEIVVSIEGCSSIGSSDEDVFHHVDKRLKKDENFYSHDLDSVKEAKAYIYEQKDFVYSSPISVLSSIGELDRIAFPSEKYIKCIVSDSVDDEDENGYGNKLNPDWHGAFFIYKSWKDEFILAQITRDNDKIINIDVYRDNEFEAPLSGENKIRFVAFSSFV